VRGPPHTKTLERMNWQRYSAQVALALGVLAPATAEANIGLPMVVLFLPPMWLALVPIILLEAAVISRGKGIPFKTSVGGTALANVASTIVGVPLLWFVLATIELICCGSARGLGTTWAKLYAVTVQAPWLIPYESEFGWMIPAALCTLAVIFLVMSVAVEAPIVSRLTRLPVGQIWRPMWVANIASYAALALVGVAIAFSGVKLDSLHRLFMPLSEAMVEGVFSIAGALVKGQP
jgi:hypothetical protein